MVGRKLMAHSTCTTRGSHRLASQHVLPTLIDARCVKFALNSKKITFVQGFRGILPRIFEGVMKHTESYDNHRDGF